MGGGGRSQWPRKKEDLEQRSERETGHRGHREESKDYERRHGNRIGRKHRFEELLNRNEEGGCKMESRDEEYGLKNKLNRNEDGRWNLKKDEA